RDAACRRQHGFQLAGRRTRFAKHEGRNGTSAQKEVGRIDHMTIPLFSLWQKRPCGATVRTRLANAQVLGKTSRMMYRPGIASGLALFAALAIAVPASAQLAAPALAPQDSLPLNLPGPTDPDQRRGTT